MYRSDGTVFYYPEEILDYRIKLHPHGFHQEESGMFGGVNQVTGLGRVRRDWLLDDDVLTGLEGGTGQDMVCGRRGRYVNQFDGVIGEHMLGIAVMRGDAKHIRESSCPASIPGL